MRQANNKKIAQIKWINCLPLERNMGILKRESKDKQKKNTCDSSKTEYQI